MIRQEKPNFIASKYAPNHLEVTYWIDLTADPDGKIIKCYSNNEWISITGVSSKITIDSTLSDTSENPVQNKVIDNALQGRVDTIEYTNQIGVIMKKISEIEERITKLHPVENKILIKEDSENF